ncbi:hypothetical protein F5144DRAFT_556092 [Chaetomium tenue]|uniref:Uncharacterized protein n=1 Tax=Chaetomium tenue TaxID=1854479 RepID=A0ACB7PMU1_9PEZI|nr:hypothetical protein F5144DRAFT_556092 [Chaetomium globosum]
MSATGAPGTSSRTGPTGSQPQTRPTGPTGAPQQQPSAQQQIHIEQAAKEARMQEHWLKWSGIANQDRTYPVVFDKSPPAITAELKRMVGPGVKTAAVHRVLGLDEDAPADADLGTVLVGLVSAATYANLSDTFGLRSVTVKLGSGERTAFVPVAKLASAGRAKAED